MSRRLTPIPFCLGALLLVAGCGGGDESKPSSAGAEAQRTVTTSQGLLRSAGGPKTSTWTSGLEVPWDMAFLPDRSALVTERAGRVRVISARGELRAQPAARIPVSALGEGGLLGIALDPDFAGTRFVYLYMTTDSGNEVVRYRYAGGRLAKDATILTGIEAGVIHDGGRIRFGPDKRLYISTGETGRQQLAQRRDSLNGKFLRLARAQYRGGRPARPEIYTLGHRNPQGFDWQPRTDRLVASEHGPDGDDEVNVIRRGRNYGWPLVRGGRHGRFTAPIAVYAQSIAPSGATFVHLPGSAWTGDFLIGALIGEQVRKLELDGARVRSDEALFEGEFGRLRAVIEGPEGALYALTNNRDGRGSPRAGDDRIVRIIPPAG